METTVTTKGYQDPAERGFEKLLAWNAVIDGVDDDAPVHLSANDWSDREIALPAGLILEIADAIRFQRSLAN